MPMIPPAKAAPAEAAMSFRIMENQKPHEPPYLLMSDGQVIKEVFDFLNWLLIRNLSQKTIRSYAYDLLSFYRFLDDALPHVHLDQMSTHQITDYVLKHRKENQAPRTINRRLTVVHSFLNFCDHSLGDRLFDQITIPSFFKGQRNKGLIGKIRLKGENRKSFKVKVPSLVVIPLTPSEVNQFLAYVKKYRDLAIIYFMLFCGLRSGEVLALKTTDIDLIDDQIRVQGKGLKERYLPISPSVRKALMCYLDYERPECVHHQCFVALKGQAKGNPMMPDGLRKMFRALRRKSHLKKAHPHLFRHTFCTNLVSQGVSIPVIQKLMGHSDIDITMSYIHMSLKDIAQEYHRAIAVLEKNYEAPNL